MKYSLEELSLETSVRATWWTALASGIVVLALPCLGAAQATTRSAHTSAHHPTAVTPSSTLSGSTVPGSTAPGSTAPGSTAPGGSMSGSTMPGSGGHVVLGSGLALAAGLQLFMSHPAPEAAVAGQPLRAVEVPGGRWRGGIALDEPLRDAMRLGQHDEREAAASVSDAILAATVAYAFLVDALAVPLAQGDPERAMHAGVAYSLAVGMTLVLGEVVKNGVLRARPYERYCARDPEAMGCQNEDRFASFYSLHSAMAFTSAGFSCAMHLSRGLYQDAGADGTSCAVSLAMATTVAALRVAADRHYLTDVLIGAVMGFVVGYLVPLFLVPERSTAGEATGDGATALVMPLFAPGADGSLTTSTVGLALAGGF